MKKNNAWMKKIAFIATLGLGTTGLTACFDENPLLTEPFKTLYAHQFQYHVKEEKRLVDDLAHHHYGTCFGCYIMPTQAYQNRIHHNAQCPYYFYDSKAYPERKEACEHWLKKTQQWMQGNQLEYANSHHLPVKTLTEENMRDPEFWSIIVTAMNTLPETEE